jgi:hypothetical protein
VFFSFNGSLIFTSKEKKGDIRTSKIEMASSGTPKLIIPDDKSTSNTNDSQSSPSSSITSTTVISPTSGTTTKKLTKILSTQTSFDRHHASHPIAKRFSIDADPSSIILNTPVTDLSNHPSQQPSTPDAEEPPSHHIFSTTIIGKSHLPFAPLLLLRSLYCCYYLAILRISLPALFAISRSSSSYK